MPVVNKSTIATRPIRKRAFSDMLLGFLRRAVLFQFVEQTCLSQPVKEFRQQEFQEIWIDKKLQNLQLYTSPALNVYQDGWDVNEAVNKGFLLSYVDSTLSGTNANSLYITLGGTNTQTITSKKLFSNEISFSRAINLTSGAPSFVSSGQYVEFINIYLTKTVKIKTDENLDSDDSNILTTKSYVDAKTTTVQKVPVWASWATTDVNSGGLVANSTPDSNSSTFFEYMVATVSGQSNIFSITSDCVLHIKLGGFLIY